MSGPPIELQEGPRGGIAAGDVVVQVDSDPPSPGHGSGPDLGNVARLSENEGEQRESQVPKRQNRTRVMVDNRVPGVLPSGVPGNAPVVAPKEEKQQLFSEVPECSWNCARVRKEKRFIGYTRVEPIYKIPGWWPNWVARMSFMQAQTMHPEPRYACPRSVYAEFPIETNEPQPPPKQEYVVLGIFGEHDRLLEEVVVYIGGQARSKHLYSGTRRLFKVPILRDITSFGLYKCDKARRIHVRVEISEEDKACLNSLLGTIRKWSAYHYLRDALEFSSKSFALSMKFSVLGWIPGFTESLGFFIAELYFTYYYWLGLVKRPDEKDEKDWCEWLQQNLNGVEKARTDLNRGSNENPPDPADGQYSIEIIVGWSRHRILVIVVIPFILFLTCTTTFALLWSFHLGAHHSNVGAGFSIASYFAGLAGASVALIGFFGGSLAYK